MFNTRDTVFLIFVTFVVVYLAILIAKGPHEEAHWLTDVSPEYKIGKKTYQIPKHRTLQRVPVVPEDTLMNMKFLLRDFMHQTDTVDIKPFLWKDSLLHFIQWKKLPPWCSKVTMGVHSDQWNYLCSPEFASILHQRSLESFKLDNEMLRIRRQGNTSCAIDLQCIFEKNGVTRVVDQLTDNGYVKSYNEEHGIPVSPLEDYDVDGLCLFIPNHAEDFLSVFHGESWNKAVFIPPNLTSSNGLFTLVKHREDKIQLSKWRSPAKWTPPKK